MSLRSVHLAFILLSIVGADLFGAWTVWNYAENGNGGLLALGMLSILGGLGLIVYVVKLVRTFDHAEIH